MTTREQHSAIFNYQSTIHDLRSTIYDFITHADLATFDDHTFNALALGLFEYQFQHNTVYQRYCQQAGVTSARLAHWREIPAVTTSAFKRVPLACFPHEQATTVFHTSGTTQQRAGKHYFRDLQFYRAALLRSFKAYCLPDCGPIRFLFLAPTAKHFPNSSLGYMCTALRDEFGAAASAAFFTPEQLQIGCVRRAMESASKENTSVFIFGTAFNLLAFMDECAAQSIRFELPAGSRVLDTGGYKGRTREILRAEFQNMLCACFGITKNFLLNEYGMTELSSQFYESRLPHTPLTDEREGVKFMPPWVRVLAVDPNTMQPLPSGEIGMLRVYDLANVDSVSAIQTEDLGRAWQDRIELLGRASDAELRGCSLLTEMIK
ncbi:hypothetical protein HUU05_28085 [candidate division KSB1 bacterium]|nr:hypothetical protein [candidate division KSB1 bacterium]